MKMTANRLNWRPHRAGRRGPVMRRIFQSGAAAIVALLALGTSHAASDRDVGAALEWRLVGPFRAGWATAAVGVGGGSDTFYLGAAGGGIWKSDDAGRTWRAVFDGVDSAFVGALAVSPSKPDILYVGMGQITTRYDIGAGDGVYRSDDAGRSWRHLGLAASRHIGAILVDPRDPDVAWVAALGPVFGPGGERGVYRTADGGKTWKRTLFVSENTGAVDLAMDPADSRVVFASVWQVRYRPWLNYFTPDIGPESGLYKSTDGGRTWRRVTGGGWPAGKLGRIGLAARAVRKARACGPWSTPKPAAVSTVPTTPAPAGSASMTMPKSSTATSPRSRWRPTIRTRFTRWAATCIAAPPVARGARSSRARRAATTTTISGSTRSTRNA